MFEPRVQMLLDRKYKSCGGTTFEGETTFMKVCLKCMVIKGTLGVMYANLSAAAGDDRIPTPALKTYEIC
jgi:hypothetical protein